MNKLSLKKEVGVSRRSKKGLRWQKKDALQLGHQADQQIEELLIRRFDRLVFVRRFVIIWVGLFIVLILATILQYRALSPYYRVLKPVPGGIYSEGMTGLFSNANPIYASSTADAAISHLVFSGLFKYNNQNKLVGDLAKSWELGKDQKSYIVHLKEGILWHDGKSFTADDVVFTYNAIQNLDAQSSLYSNWVGINVSKVNAYTVVFDLPNPLSSFPHSLINGIIPAHSFEGLTAAQMRSSQFNTSPIGTGPFEWKFVEVSGTTVKDRQQHISLAAYDKYWGGRPKLDGFNLTTYSDEHTLLAAFDKKQLNAISGLEAVPEELTHDSSVHVYRTPTTSAAMAFFNTSHAVLSDVDVRRALIKAVDRTKISSILGYDVNLIDSPLLPGQLGYSPSIVEAGYNLSAANKMLDESGWKKNSDGFREKKGKSLKIFMASQDIQEYTQIAQFLQNQWNNLGVKVDIGYYSGDDLQTSIISNHDYDVLLNGISIGVDPDVFAYWDSTQATTSSQGHLNLSEYKSKLADRALEAGRTRSNNKLRVAKYRSFLTNWVKDAPALALYEPNVFYVTRGPVFNYERKAANSSADRYYNVEHWMVRQRHQIL